MTASHSPLRTAFRDGLAAAKANLPAGVALWSLAGLLLLAYASHPPTAAALARLAEFKTGTGFLFGICSTALCGGLLPWAILSLPAFRSQALPRRQALWYTAFWAYKGFEIELLYRGLARLFGDEASPTVILYKVIFDEFIFCPFYAVPVTALAYAWAQMDFKASRTWEDFRAKGWYARRVLTPLLANIFIWVPTVCVIYSLPTALQLPVQNIVLVFYTLIMAHVARSSLAHKPRAD